MAAASAGLDVLFVHRGQVRVLRHELLFELVEKRVAEELPPRPARQLVARIGERERALTAPIVRQDVVRRVIGRRQVAAREADQRAHGGERRGPPRPSRMRTLRPAAAGVCARHFPDDELELAFTFGAGGPGWLGCGWFDCGWPGGLPAESPLGGRTRAG